MERNTPHFRGCDVHVYAMPALQTPLKWTKFTVIFTVPVRVKSCLYLAKKYDGDKIWSGQRYLVVERLNSPETAQRNDSTLIMSV